MADSAKKVALITGAGKGIGRAAAVQLSACGFVPVLVARTLADLNQTARLCGEKNSGESLVIAADVSQPGQVEQVVEKTLDQFGRVDALIHCAGVAMMKPLEQMEIAEWQSTIDTNLSAIFYFCRLLWPVWRKQQGGVVVNISSYAARDPFAGLSAYGAAKAGVNLLGLALGREGAPINLRVHTIAPAATETGMLRSLFSPNQLPSEKALDPNDVARVIVQCVQGDLRYTSGEVVYVHQTF